MAGGDAGTAGGRRQRTRSTGGGSRKLAYARRAAVVLLLAASAVVLLVVRPTVCRDAVAGTEVVTLCEPLGATSPAVLLVVLVVALLLLPDLAEIEVAGLLKLRREVAEARAEAARALASVSTVEAQLRSASEAGAAAGSLARSGSAASSDQHVTVEQHVHLDRSAATAEALDEARRGEVAIEQPEEEAGAAAMVALQAAVLGLGLLIREDGAAVPVLGLVTDADEALRVAHDYHGWDDGLLAHVSHVAGSGVRSTTQTTLDGRLVVLAPARTPDGRLVGALAADCGPVDDEPPGNGWENVVAAVEVAAGAYAQVLTDLLGEHGR